MKVDDILAVVVSYNGLATISRTVHALRGQVRYIYIVDNGSQEESLKTLDSLECDPRIGVVRLGENKGIGHALNLGISRAKELGCSWLLTMDQDTVVDDGLIQAYKATVDKCPRLVCLSPVIGKKNPTAQTDHTFVRYAITSGNLVHISVFDEIGLYDEGFFIDCIDFDFSLRVRRAGYNVCRVSNAVMHHQLGEVADIPGFAKRYYALHSPVRRYYMYRNYMYMVERYFVRFPLFILKLGLLQMLLFVLIGFLDPSPIKSYHAIGRGIRDYFGRRHGPYVESVVSNTH